jgi:hypothetical protein
MRRASVAFNSTLKDCHHLDEQTRDRRTKQSIKKYIIQTVGLKYTQFLLIVEKKLLRLVIINQDSHSNTNQSEKIEESQETKRKAITHLLRIIKTKTMHTHNRLRGEHFIDVHVLKTDIFQRQSHKVHRRRSGTEARREKPDQ